MRGVFVAGTDTGVGKTEVSRALLSMWAARGLKPRALKPFETGCAPESALDALALREACGLPESASPIDEVCPVRLTMPAAPLMAAEAQGVALSMEPVTRALAQKAPHLKAGAPLLVEAAGGLLVPLFREGDRVVTNLDLIERVGLPVLLVARARLGTLNHCALSVLALRERGIAVAGIVLNRAVDDDGDPTVAHNAAMVREQTLLRVVGPMPFEADAALRPGRIARALEEAAFDPLG